MRLASAYPNSDISAGMMTLIALVAVGGLVSWLVMVYAAASERSPHGARRARQDAPIAAAREDEPMAAGGRDEPMAAGGMTVEDDGSGPDGDYLGDKHGAAA